MKPQRQEIRHYQNSGGAASRQSPNGLGQIRRSLFEESSLNQVESALPRHTIGYRAHSLIRRCNARSMREDGYSNTHKKTLRNDEGWRGGRPGFARTSRKLFAQKIDKCAASLSAVIAIDFKPL